VLSKLYPVRSHTGNFGEGPVRRACYAADRTGHMILQALCRQCIKHNVAFFDEYQVIDLLLHGITCNGVVVVELATGEIRAFVAKAVFFATGGFGRMFEITSNAYASTGDGPAVCARRSIPLSKTWRFSSSIRPASWGLVFLLPKRCAARVAFYATVTASGSWNAIHPPCLILLRETSSPAP
jgi:succinate dehydrogenase/fumarate reductase flavoprotein subunit